MLPRRQALALGVLALASSAFACKPRQLPRPPEMPPPPPLETYAGETALPGAAPARERFGFPLCASRGRFAVYSRLALAHERHAEIADDTRRRVGAWLGTAAEPPSLDLIVCDDPSELRALHRELGLPPTPSTGPGGESTAEGYFPERRLILLLASPGRNLEWFVCHEVCHSVFRERTRSHPVALNEGLAELLPSWILFGDAPAPEGHRASYEDYEAVLGRLDPARDVPELARFLALPWSSFHADRWTNFALAWSLAKLLVESEDPAVLGRFPELAERLGSHANAWEDLREVYDEEQVQRLWRESIASFSGSK